MSRNRRTEDWRPKTLEKLERVWFIMDAMRDYWPLTLRQIYYQLVVARIITNTRNEYKSLSGLLTKGRIKGLIPWEAMEDRSRSFLFGWAMLDTIVHTVVDELGVPEAFLLSERVALNPDQVEAFDLPSSLDPIKEGDSRTKKYVETLCGK